MRKSRSTAFGSMRVKTPLAFKGERIGILGGSFNPPHAGHVNVSRTAMKRLGLSRVWWLVTPGNPLKPHGGLPHLAQRMAACRSITASRREVVTGFEAELGTTYTAETLAFLVQRHPGVHFVWVMGADSLAGMHRWRRWREIARTMPMAVVDRPGWRWQALASPAARQLAAARLPERQAGRLAHGGRRRWAFLTTPLSPLSSTVLRSAT